MSLFEKANSATSKTDFIELIEMLRKDLANNPETWENLSIDMYLFAIERWVEDYQAPDIDFEDPDWRTISAMFYMGKIYE